MAGYCGACLDMHRECDIAPFEAGCKMLELCLACEDEHPPLDQRETSVTILRHYGLYNNNTASVTGSIPDALPEQMIIILWLCMYTTISEYCSDANRLDSSDGIHFDRSEARSASFV
jgi:hypothetical protein